MSQSVCVVLARNADALANESLEHVVREGAVCKTVGFGPWRFNSSPAHFCLYKPQLVRREIANLRVARFPGVLVRIQMQAFYCAYFITYVNSFAILHFLIIILMAFNEQKKRAESMVMWLT